MLVLGEAPSTDGFKWLEVAPMWIDSENAGQTDLVLESEATTMGGQFRILFSLQTVVSWEQLDSLVGKLTSSGRTLVNSAIKGDLDDSHFGVPLSGPDELRDTTERSINEITAALAGFYALHGEPNQPAGNEDPGPTELTGKVIRLEIRQVVAGHGLALAASMAIGEVEYQVSLESAGQVLNAQLKQEFTQDTLFIVIEALRQIEAPVRFITDADRLEEPVATPWRSVGVGQTVILGTGLGVLPAEVRIQMEFS